MMMRDFFEVVKEYGGWKRLERGPEIPLHRIPAHPGSGLGKDEGRESVILAAEDVNRAREFLRASAAGYIGGGYETDVINVRPEVLKTWAYYIGTAGPYGGDLLYVVEWERERTVLSRIRS